PVAGVAAQPRLRRGPDHLRPQDRQGGRDDGRLRRHVGHLLPRLPGRYGPAALPPRPAEAGDAGAGGHGLRGGVGALRLQGLAQVPDPEQDLRGAGRQEMSRRGVMFQLRLATPGDVPALRDLIEQSVRALSVGYYTGAQIESALRYVFGPDTQLIADRTYHVIETEAGELVAAGGWSRRRTLYGGDQMKGADDPLLEPGTEAARIRAFFVHPAWARRGVARRPFHRCAAGAARAGVRSLGPMST